MLSLSKHGAGFFSGLLKVEGGSNPHRSRFTKTVTPGDMPGVTASPAMTSPPGKFSVIKNRPLFFVAR